MATTTAPAKVNGHRTLAPAEELFNRKLNLMGSLSCKALFEDLEKLDDEFLKIMAGQAEVDFQLTGAKAAVEEAATMAILNVEGPNETERKKAKALALQRDPSYQVAVGNLNAIEAQRAQYAVDLERVKRQQRRTERQIEYRMACLHFLG